MLINPAVFSFKIHSSYRTNLIYNVWKKQGWTAPVITETFEPDRITLSLQIRKSSDKKVAINNNNRKSESKSKIQKVAVIEYLTENIYAKTAEISELLGVKEARARRLLSEMIKDETIVAQGANRNRTYKLKS